MKISLLFDSLHARLTPQAGFTPPQTLLRSDFAITQPPQTFMIFGRCFLPAFFS